MKKILLFFCVLQSLIAFAQNAADVEHNFGPSPGFGGLVECIITQPDGKIIVKGAAVFRSKRTNGLVRINPDGTLDPTFVFNEDITRFIVKSIALQPDGKLLVGGSDYTEKPLVIRLNADGSKDNSFVFGGAVGENSGYANTITVQADGKILVANKKKYSIEPKKQLLRLNADGSLDATFNVGTGFDNEVIAVAVQSDGKIIAGGKFSKFQGKTQQYLIRLNADGSKDNSFITGTGFIGNYVYSVVIQNDGKIIAGGGFNSYQGVAQKYLIRLNPDGSNDTSFTNPGNFAYMTDQNVSTISLLPDGKLIVSFYKPNNSSGDDSVYRFNSDGSVDATFLLPSFSDGANLLTGKVNADVLAVAPLNDGRILIGGKFNYVNKIIERGIVCLNTDGSRDSSFNKDTGFDGAVQCSAIQTDGKTLVGGYFDNFEGVKQKKLIRLNLDGSKDTSFNPTSEFNDEVQSILLQADGKILVRGVFTNFENSERNSLVRLNPDGSRDTSFRRSSENAVDVMALQPDGKIIVAAFVDNYPYLPVRELFRLNIDGTLDVSFKAGNSGDFTKGIFSIVAQPDGKIIVGGGFTTFNGIAQKYLIRLNPDGSKDTSFEIGTLYDLAVNVRAITLQPDGKILVGGVFSPTNGDYKNFLVRLNSDGSKDSAFNQAIGFDSLRTGYGIEISSLVLQSDGKILVGGEFDTFQGVAQSRFTRLNSDGTIDASFDTENQFVGPIYSISLFPDGKINVSGVFSSYKNFTSSYFIRLKGTYVAPSVNATTIQTNVTCIGTATGSASIVSVYDGKAPYTYLWSNGATTSEVTGLAAGNYSCKITDSESSTITKNFIIITDSDIQRPTIKAPATVTVNANADCTATAVVLGTPITSDNCNVASVTNDAPAIFPVGNTIVTWTVKDASGNVAASAQTITVKDATLPTITAPAPLTLNLPETGCTVSGVVLGTPVTADNCSVASVTNNAPKFFPLGNTTVIWTVKDKSNNSATATQIVTVKDVTPPTIIAPDAIITNTTFNCKATGIALGTPITRDNCSVASVINNAPASFPIGNTTVTWTVKDKSNNSATATQIVTVKGPDTTISYNEGKLSVAETAATYKWMTCNNGILTAIPNENKSVFTPKAVGSYAVEVTKNSCTATSTCFDLQTLGTKDFDIQDSFKLYPNPVKDFITIEINTSNGAKLDVFDVTGNVLISKELKTISTKLNISHLPVGIYLFKISNDTGTLMKKVIKD